MPNSINDITKRIKNFLKQNETLVILCIGEMLFMMGVGFIGPIMPLYIQTLGVNKVEIGTRVGLLITIYGLGRALTDIPAGRFANQFGRRPLLIIGPLIVTLSAFACGLAVNYWQLFFFRLMQGIGSSLFSVAALIVISEISSQVNCGRNMSIYWGCLLIGSSLGPTFGGFIGEFFKDRTVFFCFSGLAFLTTIWLYLRIPETRANETYTTNSATNSAYSTKTSFAGIKSLLSNINFILISMVALTTLFTLNGTQLTIIPLLGYERFSLSREKVGIALTLIAVTQLIFVLFAGRLSDRIGRKKVIVPGSIVAVLGLFLFMFSKNYLFYLLSAVVLGIGRGFGGAVPTAYAADITPPDNYETTMSLYRLASDTGFVLGPIILGMLKDAFGLNTPFFFSATLLFITVVFFGILAKETVH